jgi:autotransporter passenger strand-loop-strand repeat protein
MSIVSSGTVVFDTSVTSGTLDVYGTAISTTLGDNGLENIHSGGLAIGAVIDSGGTQTVSAGGIDIDTTINDGGYEILLSGAQAFNAAVYDPGTQVVSSGSVAIGTVLSGGAQDVYGTAESTVVDSGGSQKIEQGGSAIGTIVNDGGHEDVFGIDAAATIASDGEQDIESGGVANATTVSSGGLQVIESGGIVDNPKIDGGTLEVHAGGVINGDVSFSGTGGVLQIDDLASAPGGTQQTDFTAPISGFAIGDTLRVEGFGNFQTIDAATPNYDAQTNNTTLELTDSGSVATLDLVGNYSSDTFTVTSDPHVAGALDVAFCFMPGTMIRTPGGEVAVEALQRGDLLMTADGRTMPVSWIGRQTVCTSFSELLRVLPVRIKAGALGDSVPSRDLLLSPDHAILLGDILIQAGALVNGTSIVRETNVPRTFTYYHVEVDDHSLILAENTPAETFIDNVDRLAFDNWREHEALYPNGKSIVEMPYPRAKAHRQVPRAIREQLSTRGAILMSDPQHVAA